ncbi:uncharacterized protein LOC113509348 [Galleria mellonella]|uniref:Uncharacterized protein LOC113509348 n=1 Tax=Galleria mellonella TaxID=7137 RepID=A0ABM3N3B1_GALME|nr:uncharacterized protein LOC113509348 [Galleria mellonella]
MSTSNELSDVETAPKMRMKPAVSRLFCCSVTAASGFIAAYALVAYAIALIYEIVWVVESQSGLPIPSALLMVCYCIVISATVILVHGLISKNNRYLLAWLIAVILVLIPECALVFYMSISHWGLQGVYGGAELACYVARLPAIVCGVVLVQSAYALREARKTGYNNGAAVSGSEFDASHFVPDVQTAFTNDGFMPDSGKSGSMPDLRRHLASRQSVNMGYPPMMVQQPPPAYWQHLAERQYAASLRGYPKSYPVPQMYGTWVGPRSGPYDNPYKRRHSIVGAFNNDEYPSKYEVYEDRMDCKSEMAYPYYRPYPYEHRMYPPEYDPRFYPDYKREDAAYGVNLLRHEPYRFSGSRERVFYGLRNSHTSVGNESDDLGKYKDVAL